MKISHLMQTVVNSGIANSECFLKMYRVDFVQKFVVNLIFWIICFKNQFNRRELLVNSICKWHETHFDKIRFSAKMGAAFES